MKITGAVAFALIAGILGSTSSQSSESTIQSACIKNGGPNAWENLKISHSNALNDIASVKRAIQEGFQGVGYGTDPALGQYCNKLQMLKDCIRNFMGSLNPCLEPSQRLLASQHMDATLLAIEFPCSNRLLIALVTATTESHCVSSKADGMIDCGQELLLGTNSSELASVPVSFNNQPCSSVQKFVHCILSPFQVCGPQLLLGDILTPMLSSFTSGMLCANLPQDGGLDNILSPILAPVNNQVLAPITNQVLAPITNQVLAPLTNQLLPGLL